VPPPHLRPCVTALPCPGQHRSASNLTDVSSYPSPQLIDTGASVPLHETEGIIEAHLPLPVTSLAPPLLLPPPYKTRGENLLRRPCTSPLVSLLLLARKSPTMRITGRHLHSMLPHWIPPPATRSSRWCGPCHSTPPSRAITMRPRTPEQPHGTTLAMASWTGHAPWSIGSGPIPSISAYKNRFDSLEIPSCFRKTPLHFFQFNPSSTPFYRICTKPLGS
jgi:hypothetical protein